MQPILYEPLDATQLGYLRDTVDAAQAQGATVMAATAPSA
jgi:hypothetical protein